MLMPPNYKPDHHPDLYLVNFHDPSGLQNNWGVVQAHGEQFFCLGAALSTGQWEKAAVTQFFWVCTHRRPWSQKTDTWGGALEQEFALSWSIHICSGKIYQALEWQPDTFHPDLISRAFAQKGPHLLSLQ